MLSISSTMEISLQKGRQRMLLNEKELVFYSYTSYLLPLHGLQADCSLGNLFLL